ncbi:hypothetical protein D018_0658B, partial [Vibrio parahaemolyticus VP2007-007]
YIWA